MTFELIGIDSCVGELEKLRRENGKLQKQVLNKALRTGAKVLQGVMMSVIPVVSTLTAGSIIIRIRRRSLGPRVYVGPTAKNGAWYIGLANYGHRTKGGGWVRGTMWSDKVKAAMGAAEQAVVASLRSSFQAMEWK